MFRSGPLKRGYKRGCIFCWGAFGILRLLAKGVARTKQKPRMFAKIHVFKQWCREKHGNSYFMQPLAFCGFLRKALVWRILSTRVSVVVCGCSAQHSGAEREDFMQQLSDMEPKRVPKDTNMEPKGDQNEPRNLQKHVLRNGNEKERNKGVPASIYWLPFGSHFHEKYHPKNHLKIDREKHWK